MKKLLTILVIVILCKDIAAQETQNYVKTYTARVATQSTLSNAVHDNPSSTKQSIQYIDGLGRPLQAVVRWGSSSSKDFISPYQYDIYDRQVKGYLPYPDLDGVATGDYRQTAFSAQNDFYDNHFGGQAGNFAFSEQQLENSPLARSVRNAAPGEVWSLSGNHAVDLVHRPSRIVDQVRKFNLTASGFISDGFYGSGKLWVTETLDENEGTSEGHTLEFTDHRGNILLKKVKSDNGYLQTYYFYDQLDRLIQVLPPAGTGEILAANDWGLLNDSDFKKKWMFNYEYDYRGRIVGKRVPGAGWMYMIYDKRNRLILVQDGNQRAGTVKEIEGDEEVSEYEGKSYHLTAGSSLRIKSGFRFTASDGNSFKASFDEVVSEKEWIFTKYDGLDRAVMTGVYKTSLSREQLQILVENITDFSEDFTGSASFEGYNNTGFPTEIQAEDILTITYYDSYDFADDSDVLAPEGFTPHPRGQVTGRKTKIIGEDGVMLRTLSFYDTRLRPLKTINDNHLSGVDIIENTYQDLVSPLVLQVKMDHTSNSQTDTLTIIENHVYDHLDRLLSTTQIVTEGDLERSNQVIVSYEYNELGEVKSKTLGGGTQKLDYQYNIRGWTTTINDGTDLVGTDVFGMELNYDEVGQFNGNVGQMKWKVLGGAAGSNQKEQIYDFTYDPLNRLKQATYLSAGKNGHFSVSGIMYDANGNINTLSRYMAVGGQRKLVDQLSYNYGNFGNQLSSVTDSGDAADLSNSTNPSLSQIKDIGFRDGNPSGDDYLYDVNGNMIRDLNKEITSITYNHLNLPELISKENGDYVKYIYNAAGIKLRKESKIGTTTTTSDYVTGKHYENGVLSFFQHTEGRTVKNGNIWDREYHLTDHLGNVRVTVREIPLTGNELPVASVEGFVTLISQVTTSTILGQNIQENSNEIGTTSTYFWSLYPASEHEEVLGLSGDPGQIGGSEVTFTNDKILSNEPTLTVDGFGTWYLIRRYESTLLDNNTLLPIVIFADAGKAVITAPIPGSEIVQRQDFFPFGLTFGEWNGTSPKNNFLYNAGTELQEEFGLYSTNARMFDPSLGRFWGIDVLADLIPSISPIAYSYNNPIMFNDPLGLMGVPGCPECGDAEVLGEVVVTADRLPPKAQVVSNFRSLLFSSNPINRSVGRAFVDRDANLISNFTNNNRLHFSHGEFIREQQRFGALDELTIISSRSIGTVMLATYGGSMLAGSSLSVSLPSAATIKTTLFGADAFSKAFWTKTAVNAFIETGNQLITNDFNFRQLDVLDIGAQGFLGLNTPQSAATTAVLDFKPFASDPSNIFSLNLNSGAGVDFVTSFTAGRVGGSSLIQNSGAQPLVQWGADLSMKVVSGGTKEAISNE